MGGSKKRYQKKLTHIPNLMNSPGKKSQFIKEFISKFIYPLVHLTPESVEEHPVSYILDLFFNANTRHLYWCRVTEPFKMPGERYIQGMVSIPGTSKRQINENELLLVVEDDTLEYVKIEVCRRKSEHNYKLTIAEWNYVKKKLRRV